MVDAVCLVPIQALAANTSGSAIRARALMTPRVLDLSANAFTGDMPDWLVQALADCTENVTLILDVRLAPKTQHPKL